MVEPIDLDRDVAGQYNTFRVYAYMLKVKRSTARNVCNDLSMSSPSLAMLHLDKHVKLGLLSKRYGDYFLESSPRVGVLRFFYQMGAWFIPRTLLYFVFFASMSAVFLIMSRGGGVYVLSAAVSALSALINLYEATQFYRILRDKGVHKVD